MTISAEQRQRTEANIRAATDRLLRGQIPTGGGCDAKTLAKDAGVSRAALYRSYSHLKDEFERRLAQMRADGHLPDPRSAQIVRLKDDNTQLRERLHACDEEIAELTAFKTTMISRLAAQHVEITSLRTALTAHNNIRVLPPRDATLSNHSAALEDPST